MYNQLKPKFTNQKFRPTNFTKTNKSTQEIFGKSTFKFKHKNSLRDTTDNIPDTLTTLLRGYLSCNSCYTGSHD